MAVGWTARARQISQESYFLDGVLLSHRSQVQRRTSPITLRRARRHLEIVTAHEHHLHLRKLRKCQHSALSRRSRSQLQLSRRLPQTYGGLRNPHHRRLPHPTSPQGPRSHPARPKLCHLCHQLRRLAPKPHAWRRSPQLRSLVRRCNYQLWSSPNQDPKWYL